MRRIVIDTKADQDLDAIFDYIASNNEDAARRVYAAAFESIEMLAAMPGFGRSGNFNDSRLNDVRTWPISKFPNYLLIYRATDSVLYVIRVLHGMRDIESVLLGNDPPV
jgi:toxin ParE1/3/4